MKKTLFALVALTGLSSAYADDYFGVHTLGLHYQSDLSATDAYRISVGLPLASLGSSSAVALSGDVAYLKRFGTNPLGNGFNPYYGGGLAVGFGGVASDGVAAAGISLTPTPWSAPTTP
ncbi:hypothetical protein ACFP81_07160 [Deinococcus lacus]|uniref:Uncharacterized protein n=1 Tax=Deinococcus lacus TaxID=392561 RepID=A0ABW1YG15_9DEIO